MQINAFYRKAIGGYRAALLDLRDKGAVNEMQLRPAFQNLLAGARKKVEWTLVPEQRLPFVLFLHRDAGRALVNRLTGW